MDTGLYQQAILESRCISVDSMPPDMNAFLFGSFLTSKGLSVDHIDMFSHPTPNLSRCYCFVIFDGREDAQCTITGLNGINFQESLLWTALVTEIPTITIQHKLSSFDKTVALNKEIFDPWRWKNGALLPFPARNLGGRDGRRVCVGGLPWVPCQSQLDLLMRQIFRNRDLELVHVLESPTRGNSISGNANEHFCFVDFVSIPDARDVVKNWNGRPMDWGPLRVARAKRWARSIGNMEESLDTVYDEKTARQLQRKAATEAAKYRKTWRKQRMADLFCGLLHPS